MNAKQAKDFLVDQTTQQAALENVPLSDLEKRMMYFTESDDSCEDFISLNDEFEAQYDTTKYEKKISLLLRHAYTRIKTENSEKALRWNKAIRTLRRGDHYLLVLWGHPLSHRSPRDWLVFVAVGLPIAIFYAAAYFLLPRRNGSWPYYNYIPLPNPRVMQALFLALVVVAVFFPHVILRLADKWFEIFERPNGPKKRDETTD